MLVPLGGKRGEGDGEGWDTVVAITGTNGTSISWESSFQ